MLFCYFWKFDFSKMTLAKSLMKETTIFMTDLQNPYNVPLFYKISRCGNFWQYNGVPLNIFAFYKEVYFRCLLLSISCFTTTQTLKWVMVSAVLFVFKNICLLLEFFVSNILENISGRYQEGHLAKTQQKNIRKKIQ